MSDQNIPEHNVYTDRFEYDEKTGLIMPKLKLKEAHIRKNLMGRRFKHIKKEFNITVDKPLPQNK